jgi:hypothetical protein
MSQSNIFEIIKMNDPTPEIVLQNCVEAISYISDIDINEVELKWVVPKMHLEFTFNKVDFVIFYDKNNKETVLKISVSDEIYKNYIAEKRKYPQYQNMTDSEIWTQSYTITKDFDPSRLSFAYEDMEGMIPLEERLSFIKD